MTNNIYEISAYELLKESLMEMETFAKEIPSDVPVEEIQNTHLRAIELQSQLLNWDNKNPFIGLDKLISRTNHVIEDLVHYMKTSEKENLEIER